MDSEAKLADRKPARRLLPEILLVAGLVLLATLILCWPRISGRPLGQLLVWTRATGWAGYAVFIFICIPASVLFVPCSLMALSAGLVFGLLGGLVAVSIGSTLGAVAAFFVGRYLARDWVTMKVAERPRLKALYMGVEQGGWKLVMLVRLALVFPFSLSNYAFGLTGVSTLNYLLGSWIGMLPASAVYVYAGALAGDIAELRSAAIAGGAQWTLRILGMLALVLLVIFARRKARIVCTTSVSSASEL